MKTDIEIAQEARMKPITQIAAQLGLEEESVIPYGRYKAKIDHRLIHNAKKQGKLILVTAISPTPAGEGKTTTSVGLGSVNEENAEETRKVQIVKSAISTLSFSELEAITHIFEEMDGKEGILVASKIADRVGITRSVIVNALRKFESAGVIESRSSGMKGTYIKVLNDVVFDELEQIKKENNIK